ncbi:MAG: FG-GAP-like repeat-containing protein [Gemmataceae bacterium]
MTGKVTLREALTTAAANGEDDTVFLDSGLGGQTVTLTKGVFALGETGKTLELSFSDASPPTLDANKLSRVFVVPAGATVSVTGLKLVNGKGDKGGAVSNAGALTLQRVTITDSESTGDGGGVFTDTGSNLTLSGCSITDNQAGGNGGGIGDFGAVKFVVQQSLVAGNAASGVGGGIVGGNITLVNATVVNNSCNGAGGGVWANGQVVSVNSTVVGNQADFAGAGTAKGGGLHLEGGTATAVLSNTLFAGNLVGKPGATTPSEISGTVDPGSKNNLAADAATAGGLVDAANGNIVGVGGTGTRPLAAIVATDANGAASVAANGQPGGPFSVALKAGGPAVDVGDKTLSLTPGTAFPLAEDGRGFGFERVAGANVDIGAFEVQNIAPAVAVPTAKLTVLEDDPNGVTFTGANVITVTDPFAVGPTYSVTLDASGQGTVTLGSTAGLTGLTGNGTGVVKFSTPSLATLNAALNGTKFVGGKDKNGSGGFSITISDGDTTAPGGSKQGLASAAVAITPVIDPPTVTSPATAKNTPVTVTLSRNPADGPEVTHFKVTNLVGGTLTYVGPTSVANAPITVHNGDVLFWGGSFVLLNPDPDTKFTFTPTPGFEGVAGFDVQAAQGVYGEPPPGQTNPPPVFGGPVVHSTVTVGTPPVVAPKPTLVGVPQYAVGSDKAGAGTVQFFDPNGTARLIDPVKPFGDFTGGVRTAAADFNADGVPDIVAGTGPGRATRVVVLDGKTQSELFAVDPFEASFTGGVYVAAGDLTGDGRADLVITPDEGGGPRARVFSGAGFGQIADFFGIEDPNFRGGARAAVGDVNGDGKADLVVAAGFGGGPRIAVFDGTSMNPDPTKVVKLFGDFLAFEDSLRNGTFVALGDANGDGKADVIAGGGPGGGPRVSAFSGASLLAGGDNRVNRIADFFAGDVNSRGGVRVAVKNLDGDTLADVVTGAGSGAGSRVTPYTGKAIGAAPFGPTDAGAFDAIPGFTGGVFVG